MRRTALVALILLVASPSLAGRAVARPEAPRATHAASDFDGDGFDDLLIGVAFEDVGSIPDAGALQVLYGTNTGIGSASNQFWTQDSPGIIGTAQAGDTWGASLTTGDFDGDGFADAVGGIPNQEELNQTDAGALLVLYGTFIGVSSIDQAWTQDNPLIGGESEPFDHFGFTLAAGDFDGDGFDDLAIGSYGESVDPIEDAGSVNILYGGPSGLGRSGNQFWAQDVPGVLDQGETGDFFGWSLGAGDFDGDRFDDLAIGSLDEDVGSVSNAGAVNVLYGGPTGLTTAGNQFWTQDSAGVQDVAESGDNFGQTLATGDLDGDGFGDLAVGVTGENVGGSADAGAVNVLYGSGSGLTSTGNQFWNQDSAGILDQAEGGDLFGQGLAAGDMDGDGFGDLAVGAYQENVGSVVDAGGVNVLYGTATGLSSAGNQFWTQDSPNIQGESETGDQFGFSVAMADFDASGEDDLAIGAPTEGLGIFPQAGSVQVLYGTPSGLSSIGNQFWLQDSPGILDAIETGDQFGFAVA